jgi:hypothetical protein
VQHYEGPRTLDDVRALCLTLPPGPERSRWERLLQPREHPETGPPPPPARFTSWEAYLSGTTPTERRLWCATKAKRANRPRLMSGSPDVRVTTATVVAILEAAQGRCRFCHSLAVEGRPSTMTGQPLSWESVGRRIGSLDHLTSRDSGGSNAPKNLAWSCLWCNTWPEERRPGAIDHGGVQPG